MTEIPLDDLVEQIVSSDSRAHFREVYSSFHNGNFRAAIVGLWSIAVYDLHGKLRELDSVFSDKTANKVLAELANLNSTNPKSSEWELVLVEKALSPLGWIDLGVRDRLKDLQQQRHLAAHPVISSMGELVTPNRDEVRAKMRLVLEKILTVPATATSDLDQRVLADLATFSASLGTTKEVETFLNGRFLRHLSLSKSERLFRAFWKLVFRTENAECDANRVVNFMATTVLARRNAARIPELVRNDQKYYSNISPTKSLLDMLVLFCGEIGGTYEALGEDAHVLIKARLESDFGLWCAATFLSSSLDLHLKAALKKVDQAEATVTVSGIMLLMEHAIRASLATQAYDLGIAIYGKSPTFDQADDRFKKLIRPHIAEWSKQQFDAFGVVCAGNGQTRRRGRADDEHRLVATTFESRFGAKLMVPASAKGVFRDEDVQII